MKQENLDKFHDENIYKIHDTEHFNISEVVLPFSRLFKKYKS